MAASFLSGVGWQSSRAALEGVTIRALIVDDHPVVRAGLRTCLARREHLKIVGDAADGEEALRKTRELAPHIVLLDLNMPGMDGLTVTESLRKQAPNVKVLILSVQSNQHSVLRMIRAGAHGYVSKEARPEELVRAIESVCQGQPFFRPEIIRAALDQVASGASTNDPLAQLSAREREVLGLVAEGLGNKEIGDRLAISVRTVETYRQRIMEKLEIRSIAGLTRFAILNGLIPLDEPNHIFLR